MKQRFIPAVLISLSIVAAACSDDKSTNTAPTSASTADSAAPDETVTPDATVTPGVSTGSPECTLETPLKIGFAADLGELGAFSDQPGSELIGGQPFERIWQHDRAQDQPSF